MITIDLQMTALITAAVSIIISTAATWFFAKRRYATQRCGTQNPPTELETFSKTALAILRIFSITMVITLLIPALLIAVLAIIIRLSQ